VIDVAVKLHNYCIYEKEKCITIYMDRAERMSNVQQFEGWMGRATARFATSPGRRTDLHEIILRASLVAEIGENWPPATLIPEY